MGITVVNAVLYENPSFIIVSTERSNQTAILLYTTHNVHVVQDMAISSDVANFT